MMDYCYFFIKFDKLYIFVKPQTVLKLATVKGIQEYR